jgi:cytochrome c oxidase subunit 3
MPEEPIVIEAPDEQFASAAQQKEAATLGMWVFLATEVLFFGGLFLAYSVYRIWYPNDFSFGSRHLDFTLGTINTAVLITSSFLMAGAVTAGRLLDRRATVFLLALTALLGVVFLCIKGYEWYAAIQDNFWPGAVWPAAETRPPGVHLFFALYFVLTGLHGLHLLIGCTLVSGTALKYARSRTFEPNPDYLKLLGLYWHFVDIVWIFLYPLLYFIGRSA